MLWAPGSTANEESIDRFTKKIGHICDDGLEAVCVIGSRGELPTATVMRSIAQVSEMKGSPIQFRVRWHEDPGNERSLRFFAEKRENWASFKERFAQLGKLEPMAVTPNTEIHNLAVAMVTRERKEGGAVLKLNPQNHTVLHIAAKALATLPHLAQFQAKGTSLICALRWPSIQTPEAAKFIYGHVFTTLTLEEAIQKKREKREAFKEQRRQQNEAPGERKEASHTKQDQSYEQWLKQHEAR